MGQTFDPYGRKFGARLKWLVVAAAAFALLTPTASSAMSSSETSLLRAINRVRAEHGLRPLRADARLERAARSHSREMLATGSFTHGAFASRMAAFDVTGAAGEDLAWSTGSGDAAHAIVAAWLASPGHRANLLRASFSHVGIGNLVGTFLGYRGAHVITADFAG
jgi:uncharacterized protein YkwD